jgi:hypothetical protein
MFRNAQSYATEITNINKELEQLKARTKYLRNLKRKSEKELYDYMVKNEVKNVLGVKMYEIKPKDKIKRKGEKAKKRDAIVLFKQTGIPDPTLFWTDLQKVLRPVVHDE